MLDIKRIKISMGLIVAFIVIVQCAVHSAQCIEKTDIVGSVSFMQAMVVAETADKGRETTDEGRGTTDDQESTSNEQLATSNDEESCGVESVIANEVCDIGQGLLCLNTPEFSVADDYIIIKGTVDKYSSIFSHIKVYVQHEYTKELREIQIENLADSDCWSDNWISLNHACIEPKGFFGVKVELPEFGPYTIMVDSISLDGGVVSKTIKTSKVILPTLSRDNIELTPNPYESEGVIASTKVNLKVDMLKGCSHCDFIGTSTGGLMIKVTNLVTRSDGSSKIVQRRSNIASAGLYDICLPVLEGTNHLKIEACNAASLTSSCPSVDDISFEVNGGKVRINIISPSSEDILFDARSNSLIPLNFNISNYDSSNCSDSEVLVYWNREDPIPLCSANGTYNVKLVPKPGINVGTIEVNGSDVKLSESFVVGWGNVLNPYTDWSGGWLSSSAGIHIGAEYINETLRPVVNDVINSDKLSDLIKDLLDTPSANSVDTAKAEAISKIKKEIPFCSSGSDLTDLKISVVGTPTLDWGELRRFNFGDNEIGFKLLLKDFMLRLKTYKDVDNDMQPDDTVLPLLIGFKGAVLKGKIKIQAGDKPVVLLTSDNTNCSYQSSSYCIKKPAVIIPQNYVGGATRGGALARCDDNGQQISKKLEKECISLNLINAQSGILNQKILDVLNDKIYCDGSALLTYNYRESLNDQRFVKNILSKEITISGGADVAKSEVEITNEGIKAHFTARFAGDLEDSLDESVYSSNVGILMNPNEANKEIDISSMDAISSFVDFALINQLFFQLAFQKGENGILDWAIDEEKVKELGFDFVDVCDDFDPEIETPDVMCQLRPRVDKLLGTSLATSGYFDLRQPLLIKIKGSRLLPPNLRLYRDNVRYEHIPKGKEDAEIRFREASILDIQIPDLDVKFYAYEIDPNAQMDNFGNLPILRDEEGYPVIKKIIEGDVDQALLNVKLTLLLAVEIKEIQVSEEDPSKLELVLRPDASLTKIILKKVEGGNKTIVQDDALLSEFVSKLRIGISDYSKLDNDGNPESPLRIPISKSLNLSSEDSESLMKQLLGIDTINFGSDGLALSMDFEKELIKIVTKPEFK